MLGLAVGRDVGPADLRVDDLEEVGFGTNESAFSNPEIDAKIDAVFALPAEEQPAAWNALEQEIMTTYLPVVPRYYTGVARCHGSQIEGHFIDNTLGTPTFRDLWVNAG